MKINKNNANNFKINYQLFSGETITDLTGTSWLLNQDPNFNENYYRWMTTSGITGFAINFVSNNTNFQSIGFCGDDGDGDRKLIYLSSSNFSGGNEYSSSNYEEYATLVHYCDMNNYWTNYWIDNNYRTITITGGTDATNSNLIAWFQENATQIEVVNGFSSTITLTNCTCNKSSETELSGAYSATITANDGYYLSAVSSTLGTASIATDKKSAIITIADVNNDFSITATGTAKTIKDIVMHPQSKGVVDYTTDIYPKINPNSLKTLNNINLLGSGNIDTTEFYDVTYGTTTYTEIQTVIANGKIPKIIYSSKIFYYQQSTSNQLWFSTQDYSAIALISVNSSNVWATYTRNYEINTNKVTSISNSSTDTQYPSAKAVYDAVENVREVAEGKTASYVCSDSTNASLNSQNDLVEISSFIDSNGVTVEPSDLSIGDVLYITETDVPDRWVSYLQSESTALLPSEYQELTYLQGDGNNFIDTGVVTTVNTGSETTFELSSLSQQVLFGGRNGTTTNTFTAFFLSSNNKFRIDFNEQDNLDVVLSADTQYTLKITNNGSYYTASLGETSFTKAVPSTVPTSSQYLFALHDGSSVAQYSTAKIYRHKLYETSTLSHDFIPCYRKADNITGVYDLITSTFIPESGNGALVRGSNKSYGSIIRLNKLETAKVPITSISVNNSTVSPSNGNVSLSVPTITLNGSSNSTLSFYAPTSAGTSGQVLASTGSGTPTWTTLTVNPTQDLTSNTAGTLDATAWGSLKSSHYATISSPTMTGLNSSYEFVNIKLSINNNNEYVKLAKNTTNKYSGLFFIEESTNLYEITVYYNGTDIILRCATVY